MSREITIGEIIVNFDGNIISHDLAGENDLETAIEIREIDYEFNNLAKKRMKALIDLANSGIYSSEARKIWKELIAHPKTDKVVIYGPNSVSRLVASFVMETSWNTNMRFFKKEEEALEWLNEEVKET